MKDFDRIADLADALAYWRDKPVKVYAVDLQAECNGEARRIHTMYVRASTQERAEHCARHNDYSAAHRADSVVTYHARLAGPRELECSIAPSGHLGSKGILRPSP